MNRRRLQQLAGLLTESTQEPLDEIHQDDLDFIHSIGEEIIDRVDIGPYTLFLAHSEEGEYYQVGLTTGDERFTTPDSQQKRLPQHAANFAQIGRQLLNKVQEWANEHQPLLIFSMNPGKIRTYHRMFKNLGANITDIEGNDSLGYFKVLPSTQA